MRNKKLGSLALTLALTLVLALSLTFAAAAAEQVEVNTFEELSAALAAANEGDVILVAAPDSFITIREALTVPEGVTLEFEAYVLIEAPLNNYGVMDNRGNLNVYEEGYINNFGEFTSNSLLYNHLGGVINNQGRMVNNHSLMNYGGAIQNSGEFINAEWLYSRGSIDNSGLLVNDGGIDNDEGGIIRNTGQLTNADLLRNNSECSIFNYGLLENNNTLQNSGTIDNYGSLFDTLYGIDGGTINNYGVIEGTVTVTRQYYLVTFAANGGVFTAGSQPYTSQFIEAGGKITQTPEFEPRNSYIFSGWNYNGSLFDFNTPITGATTLTARWTFGEISVSKALPAAAVEKQKGNKNKLTVTVLEYYSNGTTNKITETFMINNNAAGTYRVGSYSVYVDTKGNTQIRACYIVQ